MLSDLTHAQRELARELVDGIAAQRDALTAAIATEATRDLSVGQVRGLDAALQASVASNFDAWLALVHGESSDATAVAARAAQEGARAAARLGLSRGELSSQYQVGSHVVLNRAHALVPRSTPPADRSAVLSALSRPWIAHSTAVLRAVDAVFDEESARQSALALARAEVDVVLGGADAERVDSYRLIGPQRAWVIRQSSAPVSFAGARETGLWLPAGDGEWWGWGQRDPVAALTDGAAVGVADAAQPGAAGFRDAHMLAAGAARLAERRGRPRVEARSAVIELIAMGDEAVAQAASRAELGPLGIPAPRHRILRSTLGTYLAYAHNAVATGAVLGVTDRTVRARMAECEELLGAPVRERATELGAALRVLELAPHGSRTSG